MALYDYKCVDCGSLDARLAGLDDHVGICHKCGGLMLRQDEDLFAPLFCEADRDREIWDRFRLGLAEGRRDLEEQP